MIKFKLYSEQYHIVAKIRVVPKNKDRMYTLHSVIRAKRINNVLDLFVD